MNKNFQESQSLELKQIWKDEYLKTICAVDYENTFNLQIKVYDEKLVLYNGATLSDEVPIECFDKPHQSKPFNPLIASVFYKCGFIENWGRGTINIIDECKSYDLPSPSFEYEWTAVKVTFYKSLKQGRDQVSDQISDQVSDQVGTRSKGILEFCKEAKTAQEIMDLVGVKHKTHFRKSVLKPLIEQGFLDLTKPDKPQSRLQKYIARK